MYNSLGFRYSLFPDVTITQRGIWFSRRHAPFNFNKYPIDPSKNKNPLKHMSKIAWKIYDDMLYDEEIFNEQYKVVHTISQKPGSKVVVVVPKCGTSNFNTIVKIYDTNGDEKLYNKYCREFIMIYELELLEYLQLYTNTETKQLYIQQLNYGPSLGWRIGSQHAKFDEAEVKQIAFDILDKIWILHNCGYVHGDIKPDNIVKREAHAQKKEKYWRDGWKVIDFDRMRKCGDSGSYIGTPNWSAPEVKWRCKNNEYVAESDIFSLGLVILYALFGTHPLMILKEELDKCNNDRSKQYILYNHWYHNVLLKAETKMKYFVLQLLFDQKISLELYELLSNGMLVWDYKKRYNAEQCYKHKWFKDLRDRG